MRSSRAVRRTGSSCHSLARRTACASTQANGTTSIPLAAHQARPPNASVMAPAPKAAPRPASGFVSAYVSYASAPSATYETIHAAHMIDSPRSPTR